jgi:hypothetical protein
MSVTVAGAGLITNAIDVPSACGAKSPPALRNDMVTMEYQTLGKTGLKYQR